MSTHKQKSSVKRPTWSAARKELVSWDQSALLALLKDLYAFTPESRDFINARCLPEGDAAILESYRSKIVDQFFPKRGEGKLKLGEARKAIRDYRKATGSIPGTAELLMTYVENGVQFTHEYGDIDERFYNSVESALEELADLLCSGARELYPQFKARLDKIEQLSNGIGWGFYDAVADVVGGLEADFRN